jgi:hypothetical protein
MTPRRNDGRAATVRRIYSPISTSPNSRKKNTQEWRPLLLVRFVFGKVERVFFVCFLTSKFYASVSADFCTPVSETQIDPDVFSALPKSIQVELRAHFQMQNKFNKPNSITTSQREHRSPDKKKSSSPAKKRKTSSHLSSDAKSKMFKMTDYFVKDT